MSSVLDEYALETDSPITGVMGNAPGGRSRMVSRNRSSFLYFLSLLPKEVQDNLRSGKLQLEDVGYYSSRIVDDGESDVDVFKRNDDISEGRVNLEAAKVPAGKHFVVSEFLFEYGLVDDESGVFEAQDIIPELLDGDMKFSIDGKEVLFKGLHEFSYPMTTPFNDDSTKMRFYRLDNPKYVADNVVIKFVLDLANGVPDAEEGKKHMVRITLKGVGVNTA